MTILRSEAWFLCNFYFSKDKLLRWFIKIICKTIFSNWLKNISKLAWPLGGNQLNLGWNAGISIIVSETSSRKCQLHLILRQNYSKSLQRSGSLRVLWTGAKSNPFSKLFNSVSVKVLWLRLKRVLKQKSPLIRPASARVALLIEGSSVVIEVVVEENPPSSVLLISLLFSLIW